MSELSLLIGGAATGGVYALLLAGILLIYQVSKAVNFGHGQFGMIAAFFSWYLYQQLGVNPLVAIVLAVLTAVVVAVLFDALVLQRASDRQVGSDLVATLGLLLLATAVAENVLGGRTQSYLTLGSRTVFDLGGLAVNLSDLVTIVVALLSVLGLSLVRRRTRVGAMLNAVAENRAVAESLGIPSARVRVATWALAAILASVAGILVASRTSVDAYYMTPFAMKAFIAGILGGLNRFGLPLAFAFGLGVYEAFVVYLLGAQAVTPAVFTLIIVVLAFAPRSYLSEGREARA
ncbi:branched-chain amino acid ABC transporter permease [Nonomuraea sp. MCN248]|uniref:Branched-chain amino acid ABC transporter permease n=1 Tax=Nonomuraea corallina TaxID=2989783 RepID=A0ABT4S9W8_9ACTN|nr:branched-chain amino acid ABC transporter permease [Nonomuraea corallina]MDA0634013.1 branched-chain amino acid ABC transporter permease [Nonomuraea corallina]